MRVLVACEFSGVVREAFRELGHDSWSCDLLPSEIDGQHIQGDVSQVLDHGWDLMIAHPPCTHLAVSGARYFAQKQEQQKEALAFVRLLMNAPIERIAVENPISIISSRIRKPDQIIQPWQFGHEESKSTCLWLKNLPKLIPTNIKSAPLYGCKCGYKFDQHLGKYGCQNCEGESGAAKPIYRNQTPSGQNNIGPKQSRWAERSKTYTGIAKAMASQWGSHLTRRAADVPCSQCGNVGIINRNGISQCDACVYPARG